jgi:RHS repeat-associated protein
LTTDASGNVVAEQRYYPYGETRWITGTLPTDLQFTGQRHEIDLGIYDYKARFYDPYLARFLSPDTLVPGFANPQNLNRYAYVDNRPLSFIDPSGHMSNEHIMALFGVDEWENVLAEFREGGRLQGRWGFLEMLTKLQEPGRLINYPTAMARLYDRAGEGSSGYALPGDELLMTISAGQVNGQWTLLEHLDDGSTRPVSVYDVGKAGDIWIGSDGRSWTRPGGVDYGHGLLGGESGHLYVTFDPRRFDKTGAALDAAGIASDLCGLGLAGDITDLVGVSRSWPRFATALVGGAPASETWDAFFDLALDVAGLRVPVVPDVWSLYRNFSQGAHLDMVQ